jgi:hypothetical protein
VQILLLVVVTWLVVAASLGALLAGMWRHVVGPTPDDADASWGSSIPAPRTSGDAAVLHR